MNISDISNSFTRSIAIAAGIGVVGIFVSFAVLSERFWLLAPFAALVLFVFNSHLLRTNFLMILMSFLIIISFMLNYYIQRDLYIFSILGLHATFNHLLFILILYAFFVLLLMDKSFSRTITTLQKSVLLFLMYIATVPTFYTLIFYIEDSKWLIRELIPILFLILVIPFSAGIRSKRDVKIIVNSLFLGITGFFVLFLLHNIGVITISGYDIFLEGYTRILGGETIYRVRVIEEILPMSTLFLALSLYLFYKKKASYIVMVVLCVIYIILSQTRTAMIFTAIGVVLLTLIYFRHTKIKIKAIFDIIKILTIFFIILFVATALFQNYMDIYFERILSIGKAFDPGGDLSLLARTTEWSSMLSQLFLENPVTGGGIGRTYTMDMWGEHLPDFVGSSNISVWLLAKTGLIGFLLFLNIYVVFFKVLNRTINKTRCTYSHAVLIGIFVSSIAILLTSSVFAHYLTKDVFCILFALFFAIVTYFEKVNNNYETSMR